MININLLPQREKDRLLVIAAVRGYRIQRKDVRLADDVRSLHYIAKLEQMPNGTKRTLLQGQSYPTKKDATRALVRLMFDETRRSAA